MNKQRFVEVLMSEGYPLSLATAIWDMCPYPDMREEMTDDDVRGYGKKSEDIRPKWNMLTDAQQAEVVAMTQKTIRRH